MRAQLDGIVATAYTGFAAAVGESSRLWPGVPVEVRTGFWGCGAFGGNRLVMTSLQLYAARLAGVARLRFYASDDAGRADLYAGARVLDDAIAAGGDVVERIANRDFRWGTSNGPSRSRRRPCHRLSARRGSACRRSCRSSRCSSSRAATAASSETDRRRRPRRKQELIGEVLADRYAGLRENLRAGRARRRQHPRRDSPCARARSQLARAALELDLGHEQVVRPGASYSRISQTGSFRRSCAHAISRSAMCRGSPATIAVARRATTGPACTISIGRSLPGAISTRMRPPPFGRKPGCRVSATARRPSPANAARTRGRGTRTAARAGCACRP